MKLCFKWIILCTIIFFSCTPLFAQEKNKAAPSFQPDQQDVRKKKTAAQMTDIHDIKPLENIGGEFKTVYLIMIIIFLILLGITVVFFLTRRTGKNRPSMVKVVTPEEAAFKSMDELEGLDTWDIKEYYFKLSLILRNYIQSRYGINAPEMTTEEFLPQVKKLGIKEEIQKTLKDFVLRSDPIKFAGLSADRSRMVNDMSFAREFVKQTTIHSESTNQN